MLAVPDATMVARRTSRAHAHVAHSRPRVCRLVSAIVSVGASPCAQMRVMQPKFRVRAESMYFLHRQGGLAFDVAPAMGTCDVPSSRSRGATWRGCAY